MLILTAFLGLYLYKSYKNEQDNLKKEVGYLFVNAVNSIEGGMLNQWIFKSDSFNKKINFAGKAAHDSMKVVIIAGNHQDQDVEVTSMQKHSLVLQARDTESSFPRNPGEGLPGKNNVFIRRNINEERRTLQETEGVISLIFRAELDSLNHGDSIHQNLRATIHLRDSLQQKFDVNLRKANLPIKYTLTQLQDTSKPKFSQKEIAGSYHDLASGEKYNVVIQSTLPIILKKMWPEVLLAFLLLSCLWLAFYSMSATIRKEKNLLDAKSDFIQNMTHELKTPISTVRVALEALHQFDGINDVKKRDDYLRISQNELDRLSLLVDRVLSMSKIDKALPAAQKEIINLSELVAHITETLKVQAEKQNTRIVIHQSDPKINIYADPQWVSGIVYNLLDNAIKYSDKDEPLIEIFLHKVKDQIELKVSDNGPGIGRDHQSKIFEKFYRVPQGNVHTVKGHGLGLAFVWRIVKEMGGKVSIDSELGKGSVFNVILPA
jgi:signal transduction histidine kinase